MFASLVVVAEEGSALGKDAEHTILEFIIRDDSIVVSVNFTHDIVPDSFTLGEADRSAAENSLKLSLADRTVVILIQDLKCLLKVWLGEQLDFVECG